jgi:hypothetical protein
MRTGRPRIPIGFQSPIRASQHNGRQCERGHLGSVIGAACPYDDESC